MHRRTGCRWPRLTIPREHRDEHTDAAGVDRLHLPVDRHRPPGGDDREVTSAVGRPILGIEVDIGAQAEHVEVSDQAAGSRRTAVRDPAPKRELVAERRRDRRTVDRDCNGVRGARCRSRHHDGDQHRQRRYYESPRHHFDTFPLSRMKRAPAKAARIAKRAAEATGETSQEASWLQGWPSTTILPT